MMPANDIEAELSYAYLHAVASKLGIVCEATHRNADNLGIDARLDFEHRFSELAILTSMSLHVQLKATRKAPAKSAAGLSYFLDKSAYDELRQTTALTPKLLVVLFLPEQSERWLSHSTDELVLRKCAYWTCLAGEPETSNRSGVTVTLANALSPAALLGIFERIAHRLPLCDRLPESSRETRATGQALDEGGEHG